MLYHMSIHLTTDGHLGGLQFPAINAMNIPVQVFVWTHFHVSWVIPMSGMMRSCDEYVFNCLRD